MSANNIAHIIAGDGSDPVATKAARQVAKLNIAQAKRQGKVVADDGSISGDADSSKTYYRNNNVYELDALSLAYGTVEDADPLLTARPWTTVVALTTPISLEEALPSTVLLELESWYDASDGESFTPGSPTDGQTFTQWADKSAFAHNANPIGGATTRASYQTNEQNTLSVVRFDGNDGLSINPYASLASAPALTVFAVMKMTATTGNPRVWTTNSGATEFYYDSTAGKFVVEAAGGVGTSTVVNAAGFHIHSFAFDGTQTTNAASLKYRYDKTDITLSFTGTVGDTMSADNTTLYIGNANGSNFFTGDIAEFLIFTKTLTATQTQNVENYLSTKWGL
jgi:hypothetical protein